MQPWVRGNPSQAAEQRLKSRGRKSKRSKRSASLHVMKFELADAKTSLPAGLQRSGKKMSMPSLLTMETQAKVKQNQTTETTVDDNLVSSGESAAETKRLYVYKDAPSSTYIKSKKSTIGLPHEVHKVITQLIKDGNGGKAYVKYLPHQNSNYEHFKTKAIAYSHKPALKYVPVKSVEPVQVHIQPVPVVEQLRYVYKPAYAKILPSHPPLASQLWCRKHHRPLPLPKRCITHTVRSWSLLKQEKCLLHLLLFPLIIIHILSVHSLGHLSRIPCKLSSYMGLPSITDP